MSTIKTGTITGHPDAGALTVPSALTIGNTIITNNSAGSTVITGEGGTVTTNIQQGLCKAWVNAGNDASRNDSFNIDGETDHTNGTYSYNLINHMAGTNQYAQAGISRASTDGRIVTRDTGNDTAGVIAVEVTQDDGALVDSNHDVFIVGDLA